MIAHLVNLLREPTLAGMDVDTDLRIELHRSILQKKQLLARVFTENHLLFRSMADRWLPVAGLEIELGGGAAPMRDSYPDVLATDVVPGKHLDLVLDAERMDLPEHCVRALYCQNSFHHFPHPSRFFSEAERVLVPGGGIVLLEPYHGLFASFLYRRLFTTEGFDKAYPSWETPASGPMNGANQALSYIVFVRDRDEFRRRHPGLDIVHEQTVGNYLKYLISGGLNFRQLLPNWTAGLLGAVESLATPVERLLALHHIVVLRKQAP